LTAADYKKTFDDDGYCIVKEALTGEEIALMRKEADAVVQRVKNAKEDHSFLWGGEWLDDKKRAKLDINGVHDTQFHSAAFARLLMNERVLDVVESILGVNVQLHHTKLIVKPPETGAPFPMHQDFPYFPHKNDSMLAAMHHFDDANVENGCLRVVPGSHKLGRLATHPGGLYLDPQKYPVEDAMPCEVSAGDVVIFSYLTIHGSGVNASSRPRRNWLVQMRAADDFPEVETHLSRGQGMMLRGYDPLVRMTSL
jgi:ectoine hydroxylase-related dioxygenase (phytanoyl-CoA dioxygenase family)